MSEHSPEPWKKLPGVTTYHGKTRWFVANDTNVLTACFWGDEQTPPITDSTMEANADRICACVNACAGISTDVLTDRALTLMVTTSSGRAYAPPLKSRLGAILRILLGGPWEP